MMRWLQTPRVEPEVIKVKGDRATGKEESKLALRDVSSNKNQVKKSFVSWRRSVVPYRSTKNKLMG